MMALFAMTFTILAHADEWKSIRVPRPIAVNKPHELLPYEVSREIARVNELLHADPGNTFGMEMGFSTEILKDGEIHSAYDVAERKLSVDALSAILNSDHCEIHDAFSLYRPGLIGEVLGRGMSLHGKLRLHVYQDQPTNVVSMWGTGAPTRQLLVQEYFNAHAMISCYIVLITPAGQDPKPALDAVNAAGPYAPLLKNLSSRN
jgi:hypothetical protein